MSTRSARKISTSPGTDAPASLPWWLAGTDEECPHCGQAYAYEVEVRCIDCDEALCPLCAAWVEKRSYCPGCVPAGGR